MMNLPSNTILQSGKYRIRRFISSGGFGCTYEAEHILLEKRVAIKEFFVKDFCNRDETTARVTVGTISKKGLVEKLRSKFIEEAKALSKLHHPGIVSVSDVFEENGTAYFVMDYIEGRSLSEILREQGPLPEERSVRYISQVADALQYVHDNNRLHLDLKPGNIMVDHNDRPILIDFGASKQYDELDGENTSTLLGTTPGYSPPEQMSRSVVKFLPATDIYSLGATLYKLLTNITPPDASLRISGENLAPLPDKISAAVQNAVTSAMEINKGKRPQTLSAFVKLLETNPNIMDDTTLVVGSITDSSMGIKIPVTGAAKHTSKSKPKIIISIICIAVVLLLVIVYFETRPSQIYNDQSSIVRFSDLVDSISLSETSLTLDIGESATLSVNYDFSDYKPIYIPAEVPINWSSSNPSVAIVDSLGKVTAISFGGATIMASCGEKKANCKITVGQPNQSTSVTEIYMQPTRSIDATVGETFKIDYRTTPASAKDKIIWSSSNTSVATISSNGIITAEGNGQTNIVAKVNGVSAKCVLEISIKTKEMSISHSDLALKVGQTQTITAYNYGNSLSWESSNTKVATVSATGIITAVGPGEATIWARGTTTGKPCFVIVTGNNPM